MQIKFYLMLCMSKIELGVKMDIIDSISTEPDPAILKIVTKSNQILLKKQIKEVNNMSKVLNLKNNGALKSVLVVTFIVVMSLCFFAACGGTNVVGTWKLDRVVNDGTTINSTDTDKGEYAEDFNNVLVLNEDKTGSIKIKADSASEGTWTQTNNTITITVDENDTTFTLSGNELIYDNEGVRYFYKKSA